MLMLLIGFESLGHTKYEPKFEIAFERLEIPKKKVLTKV